MSGLRRRTLGSGLAMARIAGPPAARRIVPSAAPPVGAPSLVAQLIALEPAPGRWYAIEPGDTISEVARAALDAYQGRLGNAGTTRRAYIHCMIAGNRWNSRLYASSWDGPGHSRATHVDGLGLARAFTPVNEAAIPRLRSGQWPRRTFTEAGALAGPRGTELGLLWLPEIDGFVYVDGHWMPVCSDLDPPALVLDQLQANFQRSR